ncbi:MAG: hypothetical protein O2884_13855 [Chloroflexi bacterium]|nr:hypothetical protein [Chloroflexota bacterium]
MATVQRLVDAIGAHVPVRQLEALQEARWHRLVGPDLTNLLRPLRGEVSLDEHLEGSTALMLFTKGRDAFLKVRKTRQGFKQVRRLIGLTLGVACAHDLYATPGSAVGQAGCVGGMGTKRKWDRPILPSGARGALCWPVSAPQWPSVCVYGCAASQSPARRWASSIWEGLAGDDAARLP